MINKEQPNMLSVTALAKFLIDAWHESKCPQVDDCTKCKYNTLCARIEELEKVVSK